MWRYTAICLVTLVGCTTVAGLDSLEFRDLPPGQGGGSTSATMGSGATGGTTSRGGGGGSTMTGGGGTGGQGGLRAASWTEAVDAHYPFDDPNDLGAGRGPSLVPIGAPQDTSGVVGAGAVAFVPEDRFESPDSSFNLELGDSVTVLAWTRVVSAPNGDIVEIVNKYTSGNSSGFSFDYNDDKLVCWIGNGTDFTRLDSPPGTFPKDTWVHWGCRFDNQNNAITAFIDGAVVGTLGRDEIAPATTSFKLVSASYPLEGAVDDMVFHRGVLSDEAVRRIYACGVDGDGCECDPEDPTAYLDCGNLDPDCDALPACNATAP